ncbi:MAG: ABC transporter ATP-binding protein [Oscillospiraceae bacterium]|nr:ABC transporter ATP-binding protein [Oscillospiraceae bacterium]
MWFIFAKFGRKQKDALIPLKNYYVLSDCVGKEKDGRSLITCILLEILILICTSLWDIYADNANGDHMMATAGLLITVIFGAEISIEIMMYIYKLKISLALTERFGRRKRWIILWMTIPGITMLWWGLSKKFVIAEDNGTSNAVFDDSSEGLDLSVNIRKRTARDLFRTKTLLKEIDMKIPKGHMVLLLGGSGAGKTTFLNAVTGYEKADADILIGDRNVYRDYRNMKYDIGFVPQLDLMRGNDSVYRTVSDAAFLRLPYYMKDAEKKERVDGVLNKFGLWSVRKSLVEKLSGGQRKRLSIAMEYISNPSLFILDEPDSGLDGVMARELFESLRSIADTNKIVIVITHTPDRVIDLFDDVIVLAKDSSRTGRLAYYGSVEGSYDFFGKSSMEEILLSINQKDEGGEGRAEEFVEKYRALVTAEEGAAS